MVSIRSISEKKCEGEEHSVNSDQVAMDFETPYAHDIWKVDSETTTLNHRCFMNEDFDGTTGICTGTQQYIQQLKKHLNMQNADKSKSVVMSLARPCTRLPM